MRYLMRDEDGNTCPKCGGTGKIRNYRTQRPPHFRVDHDAVEAAATPTLKALWAKSDRQVQVLLERCNQIAELAAAAALGRGETELRQSVPMLCPHCGWNAPRFDFGPRGWVCGICERDVPAPGENRL
jgi:predicted RNA-binding Zn-ribbon protein involved in translation (DUF1610 family)